MKELVQIQAELKAPKNQRNNFGGYNYRSAEDILEAAKKVLHKYDCFLTLSDSIEMVGNRVYVVATATLTNAEGKQVTTKAYAREEESKKGMDASQITGSASSYARKYALNGLFSIDDTKDADATNTHGKEIVKVTGKEIMAQAPQTKGKDDVLKEVAGCNDLAKLKAIYEEHRNEKYNKELYDAVLARKAQIEGGAK